MTTLHLQQAAIARRGRVLYRELEMLIQPGDCWGILAPNGAGKTTLLHTLSGHLPLHAGSLLLDDKPFASYSIRETAKQIGILFQERHFAFPQTVQAYCEDALYPRKPFFAFNTNQHAAEIQQTLNTLSLHQLAAESLPTLSGGEQQRAAIAALIIQSPAIYLLDEPTNHLDLQYQAQVMQLFANLSATKSVVMSVHDINLAARYCNKLLMLFSDGTALSGATSDLLTAERLSHLYQYPIDAHALNQQTYWLPR